MRIRFDEQLNHLNKKMIEMGAECESIIAHSTSALLEGNIEAAREAMEQGYKIDQMEREIETICLKLLLQQQPVARDLRVISAALKMITDMERIGDNAEDIAEIAKYMVNQKFIKDIVHIPQMADATISMVKRSIDAFVNKDRNLAEEVRKSDDIVDNLFNIIKDELIEKIQENKSNGEQAIDLLMIAKYFERIGDHAENIAEWVIFSITGEH